MFLINIRQFIIKVLQFSNIYQNNIFLIRIN